MSICRLCGEDLPQNSFYYRTDTKKYRTECHSCFSNKRAEYHKENKTRISEKGIQRRSNFPISKILKQAQSSANRKQLDFNLDASDIVIPEFCKYLGIKLTNIQGNGFVDSNISIDRIDPTKGYVKGNVEIISRKANIMKNNASKDELILFAESILRIYK